MFELVEIKSGIRMAHTNPGEFMSTTLFDTREKAVEWGLEKGLITENHEVRPALQDGWKK